MKLYLFANIAVGALSMLMCIALLLSNRLPYERTVTVREITIRLIVSAACWIWAVVLFLTLFSGGPK